MNELLNKFEGVKIENINRIDDEDEEFCIKINNIYNETLECYKNILDNLISVYNRQIVTVDDEYDLFISMFDNFGISRVIDSILKLKTRFIGKVYDYFSRKYKVTIDYEKICLKYKDVECEYSMRTNKDNTLNTNIITYVYLDYNIILDEIFSQLGGLSFLEKSIDEIKQKAKMPLRYNSYRKYWNYEVKGRIIKFKVSIRDLYPALYYYDSNETKLVNFHMYNKVEDYKSYDNGNTDIKFLNSEYALEFAKKYLGYVEMTEQEKEDFKNKCSW